VSSTLNRVDWNAEIVRGDLGHVVQQLKAKSGKGQLVSRLELGSGAVALRYEPIRNQPQ